MSNLRPVHAAEVPERIWLTDRAYGMTTSELVFFEGAHLQHIVDRDEHLRLKRKADQFRAVERRRGSRARRLRLVNH